jgi:hypothetical protein
MALAAGHASGAARERRASRAAETGDFAGRYDWLARTVPSPGPANLGHAMGSLIKKRRKRMRKKKHKKMLKRTRWQRRAAGK